MATACFNWGVCFKIMNAYSLLAFFSLDHKPLEGRVQGFLYPLGEKALLVSLKYFMFLNSALEARHSDF